MTRPRALDQRKEHTCVWLAGYAVLPRLGVYKPIWKYDLETLEQDLSAHLVFGTATAAAYSIRADAADEQ